jgi:hypothetical protein
VYFGPYEYGVPDGLSIVDKMNGVHANGVHTNGTAKQGVSSGS